ncbi:MAG: N-formylglutamate amidohydrolase [Beijerinckiaceae bacterium]
MLLLCDHASNALPAEFGSLGLPAEAFARHIAYDIGAAGITRRLARLLDCPALLTTFSRLLIDPNRGADDPTLVMRVSDGAIIPGNARIDRAEIERRRLAYWQPYRDRTAALLDAMIAAGPAPTLIAVHSFTPAWKGERRPWHVGILWDVDDRLARLTIDGLAAEGDLIVGDNEPYDGALEGDTMFVHGTMRGLPHMLIEIRQDLVTDAAGEAEWAARLARVLRPILAQPELHRVKRYGSRAIP